MKIIKTSFLSLLLSVSFFLWPVYAQEQGSITGHVYYGETNTNPIKNFILFAYDSKGIPVDAVSTKDDGSYIFYLDPDTYRIEARKDIAFYIPEFYNNVYLSYNAQEISVDSGQTVSQIDFHLDIGGRISGTVLRELDNEPVSGICIDALNENNEIIMQTLTDEYGNYIIGLPLGTFTLKTSTGEKSSPIEIIYEEEITNINFLVSFGGISGTVVRELDMLPLEDIQVNAYDLNGDYVSNAKTKEDGTYVIWLPSGYYKIKVLSGDTYYVSEFYNGSFLFDEAEEIPVYENEITLNRNFDLIQGGKITGIVNDQYNSPLQNVIIWAAELYYGHLFWEHWEGTDSNGIYSISLPEGYYIIYAENTEANILNQYYNNAYHWMLAEILSVEKEETIDNVNFELSIPGLISGYVTKESDNMPVQNIIISAYDAESQLWVGENISDENGYYEIILPPDDYIVYAETSGTEYQFEYYNNVVDYLYADLVNVKSENTTTGVNFSLAPVLAGDVDLSGHVDLVDLMVVLKTMCNINSQYVNKNADVNEDNKIGMEELIFIIKKIGNIY